MAFQNLMLLILFVYPLTRLCRHNFTTNRKTASSETLTRKVKRYCACTAITVLTDVIGISAINKEYCPNLFIYSRTMMNFDLLVNLLAVLATYDDFLSIITAVPKTCFGDKRRSNVVNVTQPTAVTK